MVSHWRFDLSGDLAGVHWSALRDLLPAYRKITRVQVGSGKDFSFWDDIWFEDCLLAELLPALHSHFIGRQSSLKVKDVLASPLRGQFQQRLSPQAARELDELEALVLGITLTEETDERSSFFEDVRHRLQTSLIYKASSQSGSTCPSFSFLWKNFAPPRVKMFGWLLTKSNGFSAKSLWCGSI